MERKSKTVIIYRWHNTVHTESQRLYQETTRTDKWIHQIAGYKINFYQSIFICQYQTNKKEKKFLNSIYNCFKKNRYQGINLTKDVKDLYLENYKTPKKEIK